MRKTWGFLFALTAALFLAGCNGKFEPTESTIHITSRGEVQSAIMESFDKDYYDYEELSESVQKEVSAYCLDANKEDAITVESLSLEAGEVSLLMNYQTVDDYVAFNDVILFAGTYPEAAARGYLPEELYDTQGERFAEDSEKLSKLKVIVTEESVCIQTNGSIKYVSDNVTIIDKKLAKALEAGASHPAFVLYK